MGKAMTRQLRKVLYTFLFGILLLGNKTAASAATEAVYASGIERGEGKVCCGVVNTDELNVRKAAGRNNPQLQADGKNVTLNKYDEVAILDKTLSSKETWYKVSFRRDGSLIVGYVHGSYVDLKKDVLAKEITTSGTTEAVYASDVERGEGKVFRGVVNTDELNVRKAAGRNNPQLQADGKNVTLNKYDEVAILDKTLSSKETWYKVSFRRDGSLIVGYVHSYYVDLTKDVIPPLPDSSSTSSNPATDSLAEESGTSIWLWIAIGAGVVIAAALIFYIKDRSSSHSYRSSYSGTSYSSSSSSGSYRSSYSGTSYSSSSYSSSYTDTLYSDSSSSDSYDSSYLDTSYSSSYSDSPYEYVKKNCHSYIYGLTTQTDIDKIENNSSLSYEEKEDAKRELERLARLYY